MGRQAEKLTAAIKAKCMECCGGSRSAAQACRNDCPLMGVTDMQQPRKPKKEKRRKDTTFPRFFCYPN